MTMTSDGIVLPREEYRSSAFRTPRTSPWRSGESEAAEVSGRRLMRAIR